MRWKALKNKETINTYPKISCLKSLSCPPKTKEMTNFDDDLTNFLKTWSEETER